MAAYLPIKLKRKDLDGFNDDFSDFSLSSPARKIRRLDVDLPPIVEEEERETPLRFQQLTRPVIEELPDVIENEERAIVLFKPVNTPLFHSPSNFTVDSDLISAIKASANQALLGTSSVSSKPVEEEEPKEDGCRSVIPWVPAKQFLPQLPFKATEEVEFEPMDAEEMGSAPMETGDEAASFGMQHDYTGMSSSSQSMQHQWQQQQQHCMIPQPHQNTITPVVWYR